MINQYKVRMMLWYTQRNVSLLNLLNILRRGLRYRINEPGNQKCKNQTLKIIFILRRKMTPSGLEVVSSFQKAKNKLEKVVVCVYPFLCFSTLIYLALLRWQLS